MFEEYKAKIKNRFIPIRDREHRMQTIVKNQLGSGELFEYETERESVKYYFGQGQTSVGDLKPKVVESMSELEPAKKLAADPEVVGGRRHNLRGRTKTNLLSKNHPDRLNPPRASNDPTANNSELASAQPNLSLRSSLQQSTTERIIRRGQAATTRKEEPVNNSASNRGPLIGNREDIQSQINRMQSRIVLPSMESNLHTMSKKPTLKSRNGHRRTDSEPNTPLKPLKNSPDRPEKEKKLIKEDIESEEPVSKPKNRLIPLINKLVKNAKNGVKTKLVDIPGIEDDSQGLKLSLISMPGQDSSTKDTEPSPNLGKEFRLKRTTSRVLEPSPEKKIPLQFNFDKAGDSGEAQNAKKSKSKIKIISKREAELKETDLSKEAVVSVELNHWSKKTRTKEALTPEEPTYYKAGIIKALTSSNRMSKENRPYYEQCVKTLRALWSMGTDVLFNENYRDLIKMRSESAEVLESPNRALDKPLLILDLDETLVHSVQSPELPSTHETPFVPILGQKIRFNLRPHAVEFLKNVSKLFTIYLFTASEFKYAEAILKQIDPDSRYVTRVFDRKYCSVTKKGYLVKDLRIFQESPLEKILLVDNTFYCFFCNLQAGIPISDFIEDKKDNQLPQLEAYLRFLVRSPSQAIEFNEAYFKLKAHQRCCSIEDVLFLFQA